MPNATQALDPIVVDSTTTVMDVTAEPTTVTTFAANASNLTAQLVHTRRGLVFDKWPFRLDISVEYQDWILVGVCICLLFIWCIPCICGKMRNKGSRKFTAWIYTRLNVFFWTVTYLNLAILMLTIGVLPDWTVNEFFFWLTLFISWILIHLKKMITSAAILAAFFLLFRFHERIRMAAGLEHVTVIHFNWREYLGLSVKKRPVEVFIWKVEDLHSSAGTKGLVKPNDIFVECHLGDNEPMRTRVRNNGGTSCIIRESFQLNMNENESSTLMTLLVKDQALMINTELARLMLSTRELCSIEDQTGKRRVNFTWGEESFVCCNLSPSGRIWIAIAPVEDNTDEEARPLMVDEDRLVTC